MLLFTKESFHSVSSSSVQLQNNTFHSIFKETRAEHNTENKIGIYLCYCPKDKELLKQVITFFKGMEISVYLDWMDATIQEVMDSVTAVTVKSKILGCNKFILVATNDLISSKWCNWELGVGDTLKQIYDNLAILPLAENNGSWHGNDYLKIYPRIEAVGKNGNEIYDNMFKLVYPDGSEKDLIYWLREEGTKHFKKTP